MKDNYTGFIQKYPYTDFHELNLDWIISRVAELDANLQQFVKLNTIKYSDPILWDITSQYETNMVVIDGQTGNAYISVQPVPTGVNISDTDYWTSIFNYDSELANIRKQIGAGVEDGTTATNPYAVDDLVFVRGELYRIISPMIAGDSFVADSNCVKTTISDEIERIEDKIGDAGDAIGIIQDDITNINGSIHF